MLGSTSVAGFTRHGFCSLTREKSGFTLTMRSTALLCDGHRSATTALSLVLVAGKKQRVLSFFDEEMFRTFLSFVLLAEKATPLLWMAEAAHKTLREMTLPATHNSCAYQVEWSAPIPASANKWLKYVSVPLGLLEKFTLCQEATLWQQLMMGVRVFDLRVAQRPDDKLFWICHFYSLMPLEYAAHVFLNFAEMFPSELLVVRLKVSWEHRLDLSADALWEEAQRLFKGHFTTEYRPQTPIGTYGAERIVLLCDEHHAAFSLTSHWANTTMVDALKASLQEQHAHRMSDMMEGSYVLTPQLKSVKFFRPCGVRHLSQGANALLRETLCEFDFQVVSADFVTSDLVEFIVRGGK